MLRELRSVPTLALVAVCLFVGVPTVILLTPDQEVTIVGQHLSVGARTPSPSIAGPAQLVQTGNTELDIARLHVYGPLRPRLTLGPVQRNAAAAGVLDPQTRREAQTSAVSTVGYAFLRWYLWGALGVFAFAAVATACASLLRMLVTLRRQSHEQGGDHREVSVAEIWHQHVGQIRGMAIIAVTASLLVWGASGALAYAGAVNGLQNVRSLSELVGNYYLSPSPVGPAVRGYDGAVIGDSRASRVGGPLVSDPDEDDDACIRSTDSLAAEIGNLRGQRVLNLACPGASIAQGLRGAQQQGGRVLPPQVGRLKQVSSLDFVVVMIGPNDLSWGDLLFYCYAVENCADNLTQGEFDYRLGAFDRDYGDLLQDLNDLDGSPQIVIMTSYDVFKPDADCPDADGPEGARGLSAGNIELIASRNDDLNQVLVTGAEKYGFDVATPRLATLCDPVRAELNPDIQGLQDRYPFHPTGIGMIRMAASAIQVLRPVGEQ